MQKLNPIQIRELSKAPAKRGPGLSVKVLPAKDGVGRFMVVVPARHLKLSTERNLHKRWVRAFFRQNPCTSLVSVGVFRKFKSYGEMENSLRSLLFKLYEV